MTPPDRAALRRAAEKATPGEWFWNSYRHIACEVPKGYPLDVTDDDDPRGYAIIATIAGEPRQRGHGDELRVPAARANAAFLEAAHPATVLALLDRIDALEAAARAVVGAPQAPDALATLVQEDADADRDR